MDKESQLIADLISGDAVAFDELYQIYHNKVYAFSYKYLQNQQESEGVVQEVFIKLWNSRGKMEEIRNLNAWLFTVTFNQIRKIFRNLEIEKRNLEGYAASLFTEDPGIHSTVEYNDLLEKTEVIIERLPPRQKEVLRMNMRYGLTGKEIADKLNINKRTVENHLSSARAFLKQALKEEKLIPLLLCWILI